jgi:hypothetical protein
VSGERSGPGLREALWLWLMWGVVAAMVFVTYARLPSHVFYNVTGSGVTGGGARVLVLVGWPISLAAVALLAVAADRLLAMPLTAGSRRAVTVAASVSVVLCATIAFPGVIKQSDLDAKPANALAALGVAIAVALIAIAWRRAGLGPRAERTRGDRIALWVAAVYALVALPWIFANAGVYVGDIPGLDAIFMSKKILPEPGHPDLHAVHLGNHEGLDGWLLAVTALGLRPVLAQMRPTRLRGVLSGYLALLLCYGVMVSAQDGWNEQLIKRGWTSHDLPSVITPGLNGGTAILILATIVVYRVAYRLGPR